MHDKQLNLLTFLWVDQGNRQIVLHVYIENLFINWSLCLLKKRSG